MEVKGYMSSVSFDGEIIDITHRKTTKRSLGGEQVQIPVASVVSVALMGVKLMTNGVLSFSVLRPDGSETGHPENVFAASGNPFTVLVTHGQRNDFNDLIAAINEKISTTPRIPLANIDDLESEGEQYRQKIKDIKDAKAKRAADSLVASFIGSDGTRLTLNQKTIGNGSEKQSLEGVTARLELGSDLQSRVTVTRLLALGVFAFAAKKKKGGERYLTIEGPEFVWATEAKPKQISKAEAFVVKVNNQAKKMQKLSQSSESNQPQIPAVQEAASADMVDNLTKLAQLHDAGVLDDEEFATAKAKALGI